MMRKFNIGDTVYVFMPGDDATDFDVPIERLSGVGVGKVINIECWKERYNYLVDLSIVPDGFIKDKFYYSEKDLYKTRQEAEKRLDKEVSSAENTYKTKIASDILKIAKELVAAGDDNIEALSALSRDITRENIAEIIPIHYEEATVEGITRMLENYNSFLTRKQNLLNKYQAYLDELKRTLDVAIQYHNNMQDEATKITRRQGLKNFKKVLTKSPQIRTKDNGTKSCPFFKLKSN